MSLAGAGFAVRLPLLPGHGTSWQELARTRWQDWHAALTLPTWSLTEECDVVVMAGLSMGGALALRIAATRPVAGVVVVNPGLVIDDPRAPLAGILKFVLKSTPAIANDILKPDMDEGAYPRTPVAAAHELNKMFKDTVRLLPRVTAPVRVFRSTVDHVVSESSMVALRRGLTNAPLEVIRLENSYHVATMDNDAPSEIFRGTAESIRPATVLPDRTQPSGAGQAPPVLRAGTPDATRPMNPGPDSQPLPRSTRARDHPTTTPSGWILSLGLKGGQRGRRSRAPRAAPAQAPPRQCQAPSGAEPSPGNGRSAILTRWASPAPRRPNSPPGAARPPPREPAPGRRTDPGHAHPGPATTRPTTTTARSSRRSRRAWQGQIR